MMDLKKLAARASGIRNLEMESRHHRLFPLERPRRSVERMSGVGIPIPPVFFTLHFYAIFYAALEIHPLSLRARFPLPFSGTRGHPRPSFPSFFQRFSSRENRVPLIVLINNAPMIRHGTPSFARSNEESLFFRPLLETGIGTGTDI